MKVKVVVKVRDVGQAFACDAVVTRKSDGVVVHTTRDFPYGMRSNAYSAALDWAEAHEYETCSLATMGGC